MPQPNDLSRSLVAYYSLSRGEFRSSGFFHCPSRESEEKWPATHSDGVFAKR
jgi:hypothetical protein